MNKSLPVLLTMTILSGIALSSTFVSADTEVIDRVELTVPVACTMSGTGTTHTATLSPGTYSGESGNEYENGIGKTTLTAICNDDNGFSIYAIGFTGNQYEGENHTKLVGTNTNGTIATKAYVSGDATSNWSMKLTKVTNPGSGDPITYNPENLTITTNYDNWIAVPATYTKVAQYKANTGSSTTDTTLGVKLETTYAAYIASNQAADTYVGQVKYTMVHPYDAATPIIPKSLDTATTMQEVTFCLDELQEGQVYTLTDSRDNQQYKTARLADGNCWLLDNLALDPTDPTTAANMNENNTNATTAAINNLLNGGSTTTGWSNTAVANVTSGFNSFNVPMVNNVSKDTLVTSYGPAATNGQAKVGIYYNYCAASVSTYCYASDDGLDVPDTAIDASQDICPANWRMPTGGTAGEYSILAQEYGSTATETNSLQYNLSTPLSGTYTYNSTGSQGSGGVWWSSTYIGPGGVYIMNLPSADVIVLSGGGSRMYGFSIRCLVNS